MSVLTVQSVEGPLELSLQNLRRMLADSATFRTWTGTLTQTRALAKIHPFGLPPPADDGRAFTKAELVAHRPYALICMADSEPFVRHPQAMGTRREFLSEATLMLHLAENVSAVTGDAPDSTANAAFSITVGKIIDDLCNLCASNSLEQYLAFHTIAIEDGPYWNHKDEVPAQGLYLAAWLRVEWRGM